MSVGAGVAEVGVVGPDHDLAPSVPAIEVVAQGLQGLGHVAIAEVPGRLAAAEHRAVVGLGVAGQAGVLLGGEEGVLAAPAVPGGELRGPPLELRELLDDLLLARLGGSDAGDVPVGLRVVAEVVEAAVARPGPPGGLGVDVVQVVDDGGDRGVEAVEVEPVEADLLPVRESLVVPPQPFDELKDDRVPPHPAREVSETRQGLLGRGDASPAPDVAVDPLGVRPVGLDGDGREVALLDETAGDLGALAVELLGAVGAVADQDVAGVADQVEQWVVVARHAGQRGRGGADGVGDRVGPGDSRADDRRRRLRALGLEPPGRAAQQVAHLVVGDGGEVLVPEADGVEWIGRDGADRLVHDPSDRLADHGRRDGDRRYDPARTLGADGLGGGTHGRAGRQAVVDEDHDLAADVGGEPVAAVQPLATGQLAPLVVGDGVDDGVRDAEPLDHGRVQHADAAGGDRAHRQLLVAGDAELADEDDVERGPERLSDLLGDRDAAPRQGEHDHVGAAGVGSEPVRELPAGVMSISERDVHRSPRR
jgi:hypothetical protein